MEHIDKKGSAKPSNMKPGDWVQIKCPQQGHKLKPTLMSLKQIMRKLGMHSHELYDGSRWNARRLALSRQHSDGNDAQDEA